MKRADVLEKCGGCDWSLSCRETEHGRLSPFFALQLLAFGWPLAQGYQNSPDKLYQPLRRLLLLLHELAFVLGHTPRHTSLDRRDKKPFLSNAMLIVKCDQPTSCDSKSRSPHSSDEFLILNFRLVNTKALKIHRDHIMRTTRTTITARSPLLEKVPQIRRHGFPQRHVA